MKEFPESVFIDDFKQFNVPTLILHGKDDQIVPVWGSARPSTQQVQHATFKVCPGLPRTHGDIFYGDPPSAFLKN